MPIVIKKKVPEPPAPVVQLTAPDLPKPKTVLKFGPSRPKPLPLPVQVQAEELTPRQQAKLIESGLMEPEEQKWAPCPIGSRVKITNDKFPWVKHYAPGDEGYVKQISAANSVHEDKTGGHLSHIIVIDKPLDKSRMNSRAMLFRWEFEPAKVSQ